MTGGGSHEIAWTIGRSSGGGRTYFGHRENMRATCGDLCGKIVGRPQLCGLLQRRAARELSAHLHLRGACRHIVEGNRLWFPKEEKMRSQAGKRRGHMYWIHDVGRYFRNKILVPRGKTTRAVNSVETTTKSSSSSIP